MMTNLDPVVIFQNPSFQYGKVAALSGLNLHIGQGQVQALLGPNGAGKTTSVHLTFGILKPHGRQVRLLGRNPSILTHRLPIGAVLQDTGAPDILIHLYL